MKYREIVVEGKRGRGRPFVLNIQHDGSGQSKEDMNPSKHGKYSLKLYMMMMIRSLAGYVLC